MDEPGWRALAFSRSRNEGERGVAVELILAIAADAGFRIAFVPLPLPELIPAVVEGKVDIIAGNLLVTPECQTQVDFSEPIAAGGDGLVVPETDTKAYVTLHDVSGRTLATQTGPFADGLRKTGLFPDLKVFPKGSDAMERRGRFLKTSSAPPGAACNPFV